VRLGREWPDGVQLTAIGSKAVANGMRRRAKPLNFGSSWRAIHRFDGSVGDQNSPFRRPLDSGRAPGGGSPGLSDDRSPAPQRLLLVSTGRQWPCCPLLCSSGYPSLSVSRSHRSQSMTSVRDNPGCRGTNSVSCAISKFIGVGCFRSKTLYERELVKTFRHGVYQSSNAKEMRRSIGRTSGEQRAQVRFRPARQLSVGCRAPVAIMRSKRAAANSSGRSYRRSMCWLRTFPPGVMALAGLGYDELSAIHPGLIMCSISLAGQTGPLSRKLRLRGRGLCGHHLADRRSRSGPAQFATASGREIELEVWPRMFHVWHMFARILPEARAAIARVGAFLRARL
jgi:hypothetical protein